MSDAAEKPKDMGTRKLLPFRDVDVIGGLGKSSVGSTILRKDMSGEDVKMEMASVDNTQEIWLWKEGERENSLNKERESQE